MNVIFLITLSTLKACNSLYMQYYFKRFFVLHSSKVIFSFLIKRSRQKAIETEIAFFHFLGNPKGRTLDHFFYASHVRQLPLQTDTCIDELVEIFLKLSMKTVQMRLITGATLVFWKVQLLQSYFHISLSDTDFTEFVSFLML